MALKYKETKFIFQGLFSTSNMGGRVTVQSGEPEKDMPLASCFTSMSLINICKWLMGMLAQK